MVMVNVSEHLLCARYLYTYNSVLTTILTIFWGKTPPCLLRGGFGSHMNTVPSEAPPLRTLWPSWICKLWCKWYWIGAQRGGGRGLTSHSSALPRTLSYWSKDTKCNMLCSTKPHNMLFFLPELWYIFITKQRGVGFCFKCIQIQVEHLRSCSPT